MFKNRNVQNIILLLFLNFVASCILNKFPPTTAFEVGEFISVPLIYTVFPLVVSTIPLGVVWITKKKRWDGFYTSVWVLWGVVMFLTLLGHYLQTKNL